MENFTMCAIALAVILVIVIAYFLWKRKDRSEHMESASSSLTQILSGRGSSESSMYGTSAA